MNFMFTIRQLIFLGGLALIVAACAASEENLPPILNANGAPISTSSAGKKLNGQCYQLHTPYLSEVLVISEKNGQLQGDGQGLLQQEETYYNIQFEGTCDGNTCKVRISRQAENQPLTWADEIWEKKSESWAVKSGFTMPNIPAHEINFYRIRCAENAQDDAKFEAILGFQDGAAVMRQNGFFGIIDSNYNIIIPPRYAMLSFINEGTLVFCDTAPETRGKYGIMDIYGQTIAPPIYNSATPFFDGMAAVLPSNGKGFGFIDRSGKMVIPAKYAQAIGSIENPLSSPFSEGLAPVVLTDKWGYIDKTGKTIVPFEYEMAEPFKNGVARVSYNGRWIEIDRSGQCLKNCD
jgi:hypothetical protein